MECTQEDIHTFLHTYTCTCTCEHLVCRQHYVYMDTYLCAQYQCSTMLICTRQPLLMYMYCHYILTLAPADQLLLQDLNITTLTGLACLRTAGGLSIINAHCLHSLHGLNSIETLGTLVLRANPVRKRIRTVHE